jgi:hypothetical protein
MNISLKQAADILSMSGDEVMFHHQTNRINAGVDQDSMAWQFDLNEVIKLKEEIDKELLEKAETEQALSEEK